MSTRDESVFNGNRVRSSAKLKAWHANAAFEAALEPDLPIIDPHHHLYGEREDDYHYLRDDLAADIGSGHRVEGTVYVEAYKAGWRMEATRALRSLGEVERITAVSVATATGTTRVAAGIVSNIDLSVGEKVETVIEAHKEAAMGRLRGVRLQATYAQGRVGQGMLSAGGPGFLNEPHFRDGFRFLRKHDLSFDALVFHAQLGDVAELADTFPDTPIILNHVGILIGVEEWRSDRAQALDEWRAAMSKLALRPNVFVKIGGMGMPVFGFGFERGPGPARSEQLAKAWGPIIDDCVERFGANRCMFESNFPVDKQSCTYVALWNAFKLASHALSATERADLFHRTACRAYRLDAFPELG